MAARSRSSDSTSAGSDTVSAISRRKSSRYLLRSPWIATFKAPSRRIQFLCQHGIGRIGLPQKKNLQAVEMSRTAVLHELAPQFLNHSIKHRKRPAPLEDALRRLIVSRLALVSLFAGREFQRNNHPAGSVATTQGRGLIG